MNIPAFPVFPETGVGHASAFQGMTLRDYFAAKAMQGIMASNESTDFSFYAEIAESAYDIADSMIKERNK